jgi:hypothetical protein
MEMVQLNDMELDAVAGGTGCGNGHKPEHKGYGGFSNKVVVKDSFNNDSFSAGGDITIAIGNVG